MNIAYRSIETHMADDGRKVEVFKKVGEIPFDKGEHSDAPDSVDESLVNTETIYIGITNIAFPSQTPDGRVQLVPREIKFEISNVDSLEQAFAQYHSEVANIMKKIEQDMQDSQSNIVQASADTLNAIDSGDQSNGNIVL